VVWFEGLVTAQIPALACVVHGSRLPMRFGGTRLLLLWGLPIVFITSVDSFGVPHQRCFTRDTKPTGMMAVRLPHHPPSLHRRTTSPRQDPLVVRHLVEPYAAVELADIYIPEGVHFHSWLGFLGGTVGVIGTLLTYEMKRFRMKQRIKCPYCEGDGVITCGACLGSGSVLSVDSSGASTKHQCPTCGGIGVVACVNCKGEGVSVPVVLQRKQLDISVRCGGGDTASSPLVWSLSRTDSRCTGWLQVDEFEATLEEMGIASLAANIVNQRARERLERQMANHADKMEMQEGAPGLVDVTNDRDNVSA